jgi:hypothetical protein
MEVTKKYLDHQFAGINKKLGGLATKHEVKEVAKRIEKHSDDNTDKLSRAIDSTLIELEGRLDERFKELRDMDVRSQVLTLQRRLEKLEAHIFGKNY